MNEKLIDIGLKSGMLNYVDNETPRHYFLSGHADIKDLEKFYELVLNEFIDNVKVWEKDSRNHISYMLEKHFKV